MVILEFKPLYSAVENTYVNKNFRTSIKLEQARAVAILSYLNAGLKVKEFPAKTVKKHVTGNGNSDKISVQEYLKFHIENITDHITSSDQSDAIAVALCGISGMNPKIARKTQLVFALTRVLL